MGKSATVKSAEGTPRRPPSPAKEKKKLAKPTPSRKARPKKGAPISEVELLFRLRLVEQALINGKRTGQILEELESHGRILTPPTVQRYMLRVRDKWAQEDSILRPLWRERQLRKLHEVAEKLETAGAWGHWIQLQKLIADIEGNLAPLKVDHTHRDRFSDWTLEELREYINSDGRTLPQRIAEESGGAGRPSAIWANATAPQTQENHTLQ